MTRRILENRLNVLFPSRLHLHHIDLNRKNNSLDNLIFVDESLHRKIHALIEKGEYLEGRLSLTRWLESIGKIRYGLKCVSVKNRRKG